MSDDAWRWIYLEHMDALSFKLPKKAPVQRVHVGVEELATVVAKVELTRERLTKMIMKGELSISDPEKKRLD